MGSAEDLMNRSRTDRLIAAGIDESIARDIVARLQPLSPSLRAARGGYGTSLIYSISLNTPYSMP